LFVGSTAELQKMLKRESEKDNDSNKWISHR
jgi:hypothetical protein